MSAERNERAGLVVEFTGVTGAGKSTLFAAVKRRLQRDGVRYCDVNDLLLEGLLPRQASESTGRAPLRSMLQHLAAMPPFVSALGTRAGMEMSRAALRIISRDAGSFGNAARLARNFVRRLGTQTFLTQSREQLRRFDYVLWDEGIVHSIHNLFVHAGAAPRDEELDAFLPRLPLPDVVVQITAPREQLVACTLARGHSRVPTRREDVQAFVARAAHVFQRLADFAPMQDRIIAIDNPTADAAAVLATIDARAGRIVERLNEARLLQVRRQTCPDAAEQRSAAASCCFEEATA